MKMRYSSLLWAVVAGSALGSAGLARAQNPAAGRAIFRSQCSICHSVEPGRNMIGPSLFGVVGRPAAQVRGFPYSAATKDSGLTWTPATLDRFLASPRGVVPHTRMMYNGLRDPQARADLIAYLATLH